MCSAYLAGEQSIQMAFDFFENLRRSFGDDLIESLIETNECYQLVLIEMADGDPKRQENIIESILKKVPLNHILSFKQKQTRLCEESVGMDVEQSNPTDSKMSGLCSWYW